MPTETAATLNQPLVDLSTRAREKHEANLATYREGIRKMATTGGQLQADETDRMLQAAGDLGIPIERIGTDTEMMIRVSRLEAEIEDVLNRNAVRREPLARLKAEHAEAKEKWSRVRVECEQKLKAAAAELDAAYNACASIEQLRDERVDQQQAALLNLRNAAPWLFGSVPPETIRRFVS